MRLTQRLWTGYGGYALGFASLFVVWQLASLYLVSSVLFPPPTIVFHKGLVLAKNGVLLANLAASLQRILAGFVAGSLLGIPVGLAMGSFRPVRRLLDQKEHDSRGDPRPSARSRHSLPDRAS